MVNSRVNKLLVTLLLAVVFSVPASAQNYWLQPSNNDNCITLEIFKPWLAGDGGDAFGSSVWFLSSHIRLIDNLSLVMDMSVSSLDWDYGHGQTQYGCPYVGIEKRSILAGGTQYFMGRIGVRLPTALDDKHSASQFAVLTNYNRLEAFIHDYFTIYGGGGFGKTLSGGMRYDICFGTALLVPTEGFRDNELFIDYNFQFSFPLKPVELAAGLAGRLQATGHEMNFDERTVHQIGVMGNMHFGNFRPGLQLRLPLDDSLSEYFDYIIGLNLTMDL